MCEGVSVCGGVVEKMGYTKLSPAWRYFRAFQTQREKKVKYAWGWFRYTKNVCDVKTAPSPHP